MRRKVDESRAGKLLDRELAPTCLLAEGAEKYPKYPSTELNELHWRRHELERELALVEGQISEKCRHPQDAFGFRRYNDTDTLGNIVRTHYVLVCQDCRRVLIDKCSR